MKPYLLLLCFVMSAFLGICQAENLAYTLVIKRVDSILHTVKKYRKAAMHIDAIPDSIKDISAGCVYISDSLGNPISEKVYCYYAGYKIKGEHKVVQLYNIYYSLSENRITSVSKKKRRHKQAYY